MKGKKGSKGFLPGSGRPKNRRNDAPQARGERGAARKQDGRRDRPEGTGPRERAAAGATVEPQRSLPERLVGSLRESATGEWSLLPFDARLKLEVEVVGIAGRGAGRPASGDYAVVALDPNPVEEGRARGRIVELLGPLSRPGTDSLVMLRHHGIPDALPEEVRREARAFPADPTRRDLAGREDLRRQLLVTIDGPSARDFDDAISVRRLKAGRFQLGVHIADVAHYVTPGSALDAEAYRRGTSVYYPERAIPMLPEELSAGLCSLRPQVPRLALSVFLDIAPDGAVLSRRFAATVIKSARRMTYEEVRRLLEEPRDLDAETYGQILPMLDAARDLMTALHERRIARGSLDFDLPEGGVVLDTDGVTIGIRAGERSVAHRIIEELMIAANEAVAEELVERGAPALFRVHRAPDRERLLELSELLAPLGIRLAGSTVKEAAEKARPAALQEVLREVAGRPEEEFVSALVLRAQQRAVYSPSCDGHYALASEFYLHFTSPIRRYPDLVAHRQLAALCAGRPPLDPAVVAQLPEMAEHTSATERRAEQSERELLQWKKVRFLAERTGQRFSGRITGVQPFGLFVQLDDYFVDGFIHVSTLGEDYFVHEPETHRLVGKRSNTAFQLAMPVEVQLLGADLQRRSLDLRVVSRPRPARPGKSFEAGKVRGGRR